MEQALKIFQKVNIFKSDKKEEVKKVDQKALDLQLEQDYQKLRTVVLGNMIFSEKMLFMDKKFINCILPPNPILPGRKTF